MRTPIEFAMAGLLTLIINLPSCKTTGNKESKPPITTDETQVGMDKPIPPAPNDPKPGPAEGEPKPDFTSWWAGEEKATWNYTRSADNVSNPILQDGKVYFWERHRGPFTFRLSDREFLPMNVKVPEDFAKDAYIQLQKEGITLYALRSDGRMLVISEGLDIPPIQTQMKGDLDSIRTFAVHNSRAYVTGLKGATYVLKIFSLSNPAKPEEKYSTWLPTLPDRIAIDGTSMLLSGNSRCTVYDLTDPLKPVQKAFRQEGEYCLMKNQFVYPASFYLTVYNLADLSNRIPKPANSDASGYYKGGLDMIIAGGSLWVRHSNDTLSQYKILTDGALELVATTTEKFYGTMVGDLYHFAVVSGGAKIQSNEAGGTVSSLDAQGKRLLWQQKKAIWADKNWLLVAGGEGKIYQLPYKAATPMQTQAFTSFQNPDASVMTGYSIYMVIAEANEVVVYDARTSPWRKLTELSFAVSASKLENYDGLFILQSGSDLLQKKLGDTTPATKFFTTVAKNPAFCVSKNKAFVSDDTGRIVDLTIPMPNNILGSFNRTFVACTASDTRLMTFESDGIHFYDITDPLQPKELTTIKDSKLPSADRVTADTIYWNNGRITGLNYLKNFTSHEDFQAFLTRADTLDYWLVDVTDSSVRGRKWKPWN